jgi:hypothetical protein
MNNPVGGPPYSLPMRLSPHPILVALGAALLVLAWQSATVWRNYAGDWSALFSIGDRWPQPPELAGEAHVLAGNEGYDGVFYHLAAHDPALRRGFWRYADNASLRWRRILVPALAHAIALGNDARIHAAYVAVNLLFVFLGCWWLAIYCRCHQLSPAWGLGFLTVPSVLVSIDRLTVDTALAALTVGYGLFCGSAVGLSDTAHAPGTRVRHPAGLVTLLLAAPLARETGLALTAGAAWVSVHARRWWVMVMLIATTLPFVVWSVFVSAHTYRDATTWLAFPFAGMTRRTLHPILYPITGKWVAAAAMFDYLALIGIWIALAMVARLAWSRAFGPVEAALYSFASGAVLLGKADIWAGAYEFGRTMSPMLILLALLGLRRRALQLLLPLACVLPRILLQFEPQLRGIVRF